jgi:hypothetical protein
MEHAHGSMCETAVPNGISNIQKKELDSMSNSLAEESHKDINIDDQIGKAMDTISKLDKSLDPTSEGSQMHTGTANNSSMPSKKFVLDKQDIQVLVEQGLLSRTQAEDRLRYYNGNLRDALESILAFYSGDKEDSINRSSLHGYSDLLHILK